MEPLLASEAIRLGSTEAIAGGGTFGEGVEGVEGAEGVESVIKGARRAVRLATLLAAFLAVFPGTGPAWAGSIVTVAAVQPGDPPGPTLARLELQGPAGCATRDELVARVAARSGRIQFSDAPGAGPRLRAQLAVAPRGGIAAELTVGAVDGRLSSRRLTAATCDEAIDALAVMIVVLLDPAAMVVAPSPPGVPAAVPAPVPAVPTAVTDAEAPPAVWRFGVGAGGHGISGPAPRIMPGIAVDLRLTLDRRSLWSPGLRVLLAHDWQSDWAAPGGRAAFALDSAELDLCPLGVRSGRVDVNGCVAVIAGRLEARGFDTFTPEAHARFFSALGGAALVAVRLGPHVALEGSFAGGASLVRDAFAFSPAVFYRVAPFTAAAVLGLGLTFP